MMTTTETATTHGTSRGPWPLTLQDIPIRKPGAARTLKLRTRTEERPVGAEEVRIAVKFAGINFADIQMRLGFYPDAPPRPYVPGYEVSGLVDAVGSGVTAFRPGDAVVAGTYFGGYASSVTIPAFQVSRLPRHLDLAGGAAIPVNFFTAHLALVEMGRVRRGDRVLIECATGGVGTLAIQMARRAGAEVVGLTTSPHKKPYIEALGARALTTEELDADAGEKGFDFILNASGGRAVKRQMDRLAFTGRIVCIGLSSGVKDGRRSFFRIARAALLTPRVPILGLFDRNTGVYALNALKVLQDPRWIARLTERLADVEALELVPHVGRVFPAAEVAAAHEFLQTRQAVGKVLLAW